jgi:transposase InsO family protein
MRHTYTDRLTKKEFRMDILNRIKDLTPKERSVMVERIIQERYNIPFTQNNTLSRTTIYRWLKEFRETGDMGTVLMGKVRSDRETFKALTDTQKEALKRWRFDGPYRTLKDLREELMEHETTSSDSIPSESTIGRFLREQGLSRSEILKGAKPQEKIRLAFEAEYPMQLWMADTKGPDIYVEDTKHPGQLVCAKPIVYIDDSSRYITGAWYVIDENEKAVMELFCQTILLFGIPEMLLLDRGSPYMGKSLKRAANLIGCNIIHAAPRDCQCKGKVEKVLRTIHERYEHEMKASKKDCIILEEYNTYLQAYIGQDYNLSVHSETRQVPEERFFSFPARYRRWIGRDSLLLIFLPVRTSRVSKVGLVRIDNLKYLVNDSSLWGKKVDVRCGHFDKSKAYVWHADRYYGEAHVYTEENDFIKRQEITQRVVTVPEIVLSDIGDVPIYGRLERQLARHREEILGMDLNEQISYSKQKKDQVRANILRKDSLNEIPEASLPEDFCVDKFIYLMMKLLRKKFTPFERLSVHTLWSSIGPIDESLVRSTVGHLLGKEYPINDLNGYLEEIRLAMITKRNIN